MKQSFERFTKKNLLINILLSILYLGFNIVIGDLRPEHTFLVILWWFLFYAGEKTRRFAMAYIPFIIFWVLYDAMRAVPNYTVNTAHIQEPYEFEKHWFGIHDVGQLLTPNEYFAAHTHKILDFLSGFFYINWMPIPLGFGLYLFLKNKPLFLEFALAFLLVNIVGFIFYYIYPAAPPWYVAKYGFDLHIGVPGSRAGLIRFDKLIDYPLFKNIYEKNANVLAAMPSLHATYPLIVLYYSIKAKMPKFWITIFAIFTLGIWFSAVYSNHHYVIDVIAGVFIAVIVLWLFDRFLLKTNSFSGLIQQWKRNI